MDKKSKKKAAAPEKHTEVEATEADNVDKIRDILFGNQMREVSQKFATLEKNLVSDLTAVRQENALQIESLKSFIESEMEILASRLAGEEQSRIENMDELDSSIKQQARQIESKMSAVVKSIDKNASDINKKMLKQSQDFNSEVNKQMQDARDRMDGHRQELSTTKVYKSVLSEMLNSLAVQIDTDESD